MEIEEPKKVKDFTRENEQFIKSEKLENFVNKNFENKYRHIQISIKINKRKDKQEKQTSIYITDDKTGKEKLICTEHNDYVESAIKKYPGNKLHNTYSIYLKYTPWVVIDIDEDDYDWDKLPEWLQKSIYVNGNTKGRHYYVKLKNKPIDIIFSEQDAFKDFKGDLIGWKNNIWEHKSKNPVNSKKKIKEIDFSEILLLLKPETKKVLKSGADENIIKEKNKIVTEHKIDMKQAEGPKFDNDDRIIKILDGLDLFRSKNYDAWFKVGLCLRNENIDSKYFDYFSRKCEDKYEGEEKTKDFYKNLNVKNDDEKKLSTKSLWYYLKEDNKKVFDSLVEEQKKKEEKLYAIEIDKYESFNLNKLIKLVEQDQQELASNYIKNFELSRSFKYFNYFHYWVYPQATIYYLEHEKVPLPYKPDPFPNLNIEIRTLENGKLKIKEINFVNQWLKSKSINSIEQFVFNPDKNFKEEGKYKNLFNGFHLDKDNDGSYDENLIKPFINHVKYMSKNNENGYNYLLNWIAHLIQKPHIKTNSAIVLYSETQGSGKGLISTAIMAMLGKYSLKMESTTQLISHFNSTQQNKIFLPFDEINARMKDIDNEIKDAITRETKSITYKNKEAYEVNDYANYFFTTNNEIVLKVPPSDRRFNIYDCVEEVLTKDKIDVIVNIIKNLKLLKQLYNYFKSRDISNFNPRDIYNNNFKKDLIINDLPAYIKMIMYETKDYLSSKFTAKQLYNNSLDYATKRKLAQNYSSAKCYRDLKKFFGDYYHETSSSGYYQFPEDFDTNVEIVINIKLNEKVNN